MVAGCSFGLTAPLAFLTDVTLLLWLAMCGYAKDATGETKDRIESLTLWRQMSMFGCRTVAQQSVPIAVATDQRPVWCVDRFTR